MSANATAFLDLLPDLSVWFFLKVAVGLFVAQVVFWFFRWRAIKGRLAQLPGESFGLLGPIPQMSKNLHRLFDWQVELQKKHGATYKATEAFWKDYAMVWTVDPRNIEHFLKTNFRNYVKPNSLRARLLEFIGQGIFRINHGHDDGEYPIWHSQRKIMSKIFFKKNFEGFLQKVFIRHSLVMNEVLNEAAQSGKVIDIQHLMFAFTLDSIAEIGFGTRFHALRKPMSVGDAFDYVQESAFLRLMRPLFSVPVLGKLLYPSERKFARLIKELNDFSYQTIRERRRTIAVAEAAKAASDDNADGSDDKQAMYGAEVGQDCLSLFMTSKAAKSAAFTDKQLRDIVMSVMIAGRDTTACTLTYCISELMQNPHVKEKLLAELQEKLSHTTLFGGSETVNQEELTQRNMPYLHGFVYEVLRLHPPVPVDGKFSVKDDVWPDGTRIPAKTTVVFPIYVMGRDEAVWPEPLKVIPERWETANPSAFEFPVFQAGPRVCLGLRMAVLETKMNLAHVLSAFDFKPACELPRPYNVRLTLSIKGGLPVHVVKR